MSFIINGDSNFTAYSNLIKENYYMSTYYTLTGNSVSIEYKNPINNNINGNLKIVNYITNFGDNNSVTISQPNVPVYHQYDTRGTYYVSYSAVYDNGAVYQYSTSTPFIIESYWESYNQNNVRNNDEITLKLPYAVEDINIQPNEWGVEDIFNTSITRLQDNLDFLINKTQTINTYTPTLFFGWLGNDAGTPASSIKWITRSYNSEFLGNPELAKSAGSSFFTNIIDAIEVDILDASYLYVLDDNRLRLFQNFAIPNEIIYSNYEQISSFLINPLSFDVNETGKIIYIADQTANNIYKINVSINTQTLSASDINIQLFIGGFGSLKDNNNFNTPIQVSYVNGNVYVLDYNNYCVKQYNKDLNWLFTYSLDLFIDDRPVSIAALDNGLLYVITEKYNVYIFDNLSNAIFESFSVLEANDMSALIKISFNKNGDFLFVQTEQNIYKYSLTGIYISSFNIPKTNDVVYKNIKNSKNGTVIISSEKCILKCQDILEVYRLGEGLPYKYWSRDQLTVSKNEFVSDLNYNRSIIRIAQNIKTFRDTLNAKFIIATENVKSNIITYFSYLPINIDLEKQKTNSLKLSDDIEMETLGIGVNELHVPSVINKELQKLHIALQQLANFLSIENYKVNNTECINSFCWSWNATSCYNLSLPVIKTCSINPISYTEMQLNLDGLITYAPTNTWAAATSKCCEKKTN
jgi:hypothetical protein